MWGLPHNTDPSTQLLIQAPDHLSKAPDYQSKAPDYLSKPPNSLSKVQISCPRSRILIQAPNSSSKPPTPRPSPQFRFKGAHAGFALSGAQIPPLTLPCGCKPAGCSLMQAVCNLMQAICILISASPEEAPTFVSRGQMRGLRRLGRDSRTPVWDPKHPL